MDSIEIPLTRGLVTVIDAADEAIAKPYSWCALQSTRCTFYAVTTILAIPGKRPTQGKPGERGKRARLALHRLIMGCDDPAIDVDHVNGDGLDNRRSNLRVATRAQNSRNCRPQEGTSRFKGVHWAPHVNGWIAQIGIDYRTHYVGTYDTEEDAASAYNAAAIEAYGEFARLNEVTTDARPRRREQAIEVISAFGETKTRAQWLADPRCVVAYTTLMRRLRLAWTPEDAISVPSRRKVAVDLLHEAASYDASFDHEVVERL